MDIFDRVVKGLECCSSNDGDDPECKKCPYTGIVECLDNLLNEAYLILKRKEPLEPLFLYGRYECGECMYELRQNADNFCPCCGRRIRWENVK